MRQEFCERRPSMPPYSVLSPSFVWISSYLLVQDALEITQMLRYYRSIHFAVKSMVLQQLPEPIGASIMNMVVSILGFVMHETQVQHFCTYYLNLTCEFRCSTAVAWAISAVLTFVLPSRSWLFSSIDLLQFRVLPIPFCRNFPRILLDGSSFQLCYTKFSQFNLLKISFFESMCQLPAVHRSVIIESYVFVGGMWRGCSHSNQVFT